MVLVRYSCAWAYLAMHLYRGSCSGWRECSSRPGTEWNAMGQKKKERLWSAFWLMLWCTWQSSAFVWNGTTRRKLPVSGWSETRLKRLVYADQTFLSSAGWQASLLPPPFKADGAGKSRLEIPERRIVQRSTLGSAQAWLSSVWSCPRSPGEWEFRGFTSDTKHTKDLRRSNTTSV